MAKGKWSNGIENRSAFCRASFLYQAAGYLALQDIASAKSNTRTEQTPTDKEHVPSSSAPISRELAGIEVSQQRQQQQQQQQQHQGPRGRRPPCSRAARYSPLPYGYGDEN